MDAVLAMLPVRVAAVQLPEGWAVVTGSSDILDIEVGIRRALRGHTLHVSGGAHDLPETAGKIC